MFLCSKYVIPVLLEQDEGVIIDIASVSAAPAARHGRPIDIARLLCFLASDQASMHGHTFLADGSPVIR